MTDPGIATAADYADAMYTARRSKNVLVLAIFLMLLIQLGVFFVARHSDYIIASPASTQPAPKWLDPLRYLIGATTFVGFVLSIVLSFVLLLIVNIMLVGRLIGVARTTSAYIWCLLLLVLLFPWQAFLANVSFADPSFKLPGVLYTWEELIHSAKFEKNDLMKWARFVILPIVAVVITLVIQIKSNRGLRQAFGEVEPETPVV